MTNVNNDTMIVCDLNDDDEDDKVKSSSGDVDDQFYGEMLEERWQNLWIEGKKTPGVVDNRNPLENPPDWFDLKRFTKAQKLAKKYYFR